VKPDRRRAIWDTSNRAGLWELATKPGEPIRPVQPPPMPTGLDALDWALGGGMRHAGLRRKRLYVIGARSGYGKSALAEQIALHVSQRAKVLFFALEMGEERTTDRLLAKVVGTDVYSAEQMYHNREAVMPPLERLAYEHNLYLEERVEGEPFTFDHVAGLVVRQNPRVVVIDHLRHLDDWSPGGGAYGGRSDLPAAHISRRLRNMAVLADCAVIAVHQLKNELQSARPTQHDLADTAALSQQADHVWLIHRPFRGEGLRDNVAEIVVDKNREGPECILHFEWSGRLMRYRDMNPDEEAGLECCKPKKGRAPAPAPTRATVEPDDDPGALWPTS
jgi:replicative DNA helicase